MKSLYHKTVNYLRNSQASPVPLKGESIIFDEDYEPEQDNSMQ